MTSPLDTSPSARTGVVLAAGYGSRLTGLARRTDPKPLTPIAGRPLLFRTLDSLQTAGCGRAVVVLGYGADRIREAIGAEYDGALEVTFAHNDRYDLSNGISVLAARPYVEGPFVLTMADHVLGDALMHQVREHTPPPEGATLLVDANVASVFDIDDATKVQVEDGRIRAIGKDLNTYNAIDTGVFVCTLRLMTALQDVVDARGDASLSDGIRRLAEKGQMRALDIGDGFWQDIDNADMLAHAEQFLAERASVLDDA
jgi:choline kinase